MSYTNNLKNLLQNQRKQLDVLEHAILEVEADGLADENVQLKSQIQALNTERDALIKEIEKLKASLNDQMLNERTRLLSKTREQLEFYFTNTTSPLENKITQLENNYKSLLNNMQNTSGSYVAEAEAHINAIMSKVKVQYEQESQAARDVIAQQINERDKDPLPPPEVLAKRLRLFNMEMRFGTKVVNVLGILLILLGVVFGLQYSFVHILLTPELRGAAAYVLGILFLAGGEITLRQKKYPVSPVFSMGVTAGGIAILFASTAVSYFNLGILSMFAALGFCVGISVVAFLLSIRYSSRTIACFALVGGYMPMTAIFDAPELFMPAMAYFVLLNFLALFLATQKKWPIMNCLSFVLSTAAAVGFVGMGASVIASVVYLSINFLMFLGLILIYPIRNKSTAPLTVVDVVILSANTIVNCLLIYGVLNRDGEFAYNGLLAIGFFIVYFVGAKLVEKYLSQDKRISGLFYITALIFAILIVPLQFSLDWLMIGWIAMGTALAVYGILYKIKACRWAGWFITLLGLCAFTGQFYSWSNAWRVTNYSVLTFGLIGILAAYYYAGRGKEIHVRIFQYVLLIQTLFYVLFTGWFLYDLILLPDTQRWRHPAYDWIPIFLIMLALVYGFGIKHIPVIKSRVVDAISLGITLWAVFAVFVNNFINVINPDYAVITSALLIIFNLFSIFILFDAIKTLEKLLQNRGVLEGLSLITSLYTLVLIIMVLMVQYGHNANSMIISAIGMVAALGWIIFGFTRRNRTMRWFGLIFSIFSLAKLFFVDLYFLPAGMRIVSYFIFGLIFLAISFVYQYFSRKLEV